MIRAVEASRRMDYPRELLEIIVARGRQPSVQRNQGLRAARGDLVYFLDDDSEPHPENLLRAAARFLDPSVEILGGPNLCPEDAPWIERVFALVLASRLAFGPSRARYCRTGTIRWTSEKELILCNLVARKAGLLSQGGFDESLYPNEENALMDKIQAGGKRLLYDPHFLVHRRPRPTLKSFARMLLTYGRGRAEQFRAHPGMGSLLNFVPPVFAAYLAALPVAVHFAGWVAALPLAAYAAVLLVELAALAVQGGLARALCALPLVVLTHILYGAGFWRGLFTRLRPPGADGPPVTLELKPV